MALYKAQIECSSGKGGGGAGMVIIGRHIHAPSFITNFKTEMLSKERERVEEALS